MVANRLSKDSSKEVLLIEAGPKDEGKFADSLHSPFLGGPNVGQPFYNWAYNTTPQPELNNRKLFHPRGRVLGGSSQINIMLYVRGAAHDYDRWAAKSGYDKFKYENVLPFFKLSQNARNYGDDKFNGRDVNEEVNTT